MDAPDFQETWRPLRPCVREGTSDGGAIPDAVGKNYILSIHRLVREDIRHIRGSVSLDDQRIRLKKFSSGTSDLDAASHLVT